MSPRPIRPVIALVVSAAMCAGCYGRNHIQHEGPYAFTAQQITRDDCGLHQVAGTNCQVDLVQAHLEATTDSADAFHGMGEVDFRTDQINCACHLSVSFTASMQ